MKHFRISCRQLIVLALNKDMRYVFVLIIRFYQSFISTLLPFNHCRFYPTCSDYCLEAIETHGAISGFWLAIKRILKCHPYSKSNGYDPVP